MGTQVVHTICMQTNDAIEKREGEFVMRLGGDNPRINSVKLALGSLEFPIVQWTIEKDWNLMYFSEGYRLTQESSFMRIEEKTNKMTNTIQIHLPLYLNAIASIKSIGEYLTIKTEYPHGLFVDGRKCIVSYIHWGEICVVCSCAGHISLKQMVESEQLEYLSETEFMIPNVNKETIENHHFGFIHMPTIPSPKSLCDLINLNLLYSKSLGKYHANFDCKTNNATIYSSIFPDDCEYLRIKLYGSELTKKLGYMSDEHTTTFHKKKDNAPTISNMIQFERLDVSDPPLVLKSEQFPGWMHVNLTPGWYAPSNRSMCTGQPLRINMEFESSFNRLFFPVPEKIPRGHATSHFIIFCDPTGMQHFCPIYAGKYSPERFCKHVEDEMTKLSKKFLDDVQFSVNYDFNVKLYTFSCERKIQNHVFASQFSLNFNHPASIDATRLGFPPVHLKGCDSYTSTEEIHVPIARSNNNRFHYNTYRIAEVSHQKRFMIDTLPASTLIGIIKGYDEDSSELIVQTYLGQLPYVHGLQMNDTISIMPTNKHEVFVKDSDGWKLEEVLPCPLAPSFGKSGVVQESNQSSGLTNDISETFLKIKIKYIPNLETVVDKCVSIIVDVEPYNFCFGTLHRSIPSRMLGFGHGAVQYEIDGCIKSTNLQVAPFIANAVHCLDHPDYILVYFEEGKKNLSLQHTVGNHSTAPFAKLVLYPMFREERMLPRDTTLVGSEFFSTFTIKFKNPDGTPYHFHNADFSFSLNFIRVSD